MPEPQPPASAPKSAGLNDLSEDALGFGGLELRTARDVVLRPREVLEAWMTAGPTGGGRYARPLRLYLALNAILMLILFLQGGAGFMIANIPETMLQPLIEASGKSRDAFVADADNWMTLVMVPMMSAIYACVAMPLLRWWDPEPLGWRRGFRAAFAWLCAWTVPMLPVSWWSYDQGPAGAVATVVVFLTGIVAFMRMGAGRWWRSPAEGLFKAVALSIAIGLVGVISYAPVVAVGLAAGRFA